MAGCEVFSKLHEECGVFGIFRHNGDSVVPETYHALYALQHRGQESCGIAVNRDGVITQTSQIKAVYLVPNSRSPASPNPGII